MLKAFASNFNRLLNHYTTGSLEVNSDMVGILFSNGTESVKCCLPFKVYTKKLVNSCARVAV